MIIDYTLLLSILLIHICLFVVYQKRNKNITGHVTLLILLYNIIALAALITYIFKIRRPVFSFSFSATSFYLVANSVCLLSFMKFKDSHVFEVRIENRYFNYIFEVFLIIGGLCAFIFYLPFAVNALTGDIQYYRTNINDINPFSSFQIIHQVLTVISDLFVIMLLFAFLNFNSKKKKCRIKGVLLMIGSLSYVLKVLSYAGRDGVVYWMIALLFIYLLLKDFIDKRTQKRVLRISMLIIGTLFIPFALITIIRFSFFRAQATISIFDYLGMQISQFNDRFLIQPPLRYGGANFPVIMRWLRVLGIRKVIFDSTELYAFYEQFGTASYVFATYLGSLLSDFGRVGTFIFVILYSIRVRVLIDRLNKYQVMTISDLLEYILLYQFLSWGIFYNKLSAANYYIIFLYLIIMIYKILGNKIYSYTLKKIYL